MSTAAATASGPRLAELAQVRWRRPATDRELNRSGRLWTLTVLAHTIPLVSAAALLAVLAPITVPVSVVLLAHAWIIPELYAARGANVMRPCRRHDREADRVAVGLLGDLVSAHARELHRRTGYVLEGGTLGVWLLAEAGAVLVRPGARRVNCYCVRVADPDLPAADRTAHLLLALREDEVGFATVANLAFSGAPWRLRRRLAPPAREIMQAGLAAAHGRRATL